MCGICGELRFDQQPTSVTNIQAMLAVLAPRGPDGEGTYFDGSVGFGHRRLAVIDLSTHANQPMRDPQNGNVLVFNGTIYNYPELRRELLARGHQFLSTGDTEVILKAYAEWGEDCVDHLTGMFAFAIWDAQRRQLVIARDRLGIKPLYFARTAHAVRFASTLPALLATEGVDKTLDPVGLHHHLTLHAVVPAPYTIIKGIRKIAPASIHVFTADGQHRERSYWQLTACRPAETLSEKHWIERTHDALQQAIQTHNTVADVPVGVLLSGGLDSSLIVGLLAEQREIDSLLTFSIGFEDTAEEKGSEFEYSDQVVARYPTRHHRLQIPNNEVLKRLPEAIRMMSEPMVAQDAVAFYLLSEQVVKHVKVVQSGQGADEVFAGYFWYPLMNERQGDLLQRFSPLYFDRNHAELLRTLTPEYHGEDYTSATIGQLLAKDGADEFLDRVLRMDVTTLIVDDPVKRVDNMTMAFGLEARVPFLDHHLVEMAMQIPPSLKLKENGKYPLKTVARAVLPAAVIDRPKGYFPLPALKYVRGDFLNYMKTILNSEACLQRGLFNRDYVNELFANSEQAFTPLRGSKLWHLALLEHWLQIHLDN